MSRISIASLVATLALLGTGCSEPWRAYTPIDLKVADSTGTYDATIEVLHARGYQILENDGQHLFVRARSHIGNDVVLEPIPFRPAAVTRTSFITFQVHSDGSLRVSADGYHVRDDDGRIDVRLDDERKELARAIRVYATTGALPPKLRGPAEETATLQPAGDGG